MIARTLLLITSCMLLYSCININVGEETKKEPKTKKVRASYRSNKYHKSKKFYHKVDDVYTNNKGKKNSSSAQYKKQQASNLKNLNRNKKYNNVNKPDTSFELY
ncbi:hypothetical protein [Sporocytophaga myxococcoides]|uniref:hypothetical protein n=1 Tax=Sporocytophaga myxococcoides TaxID=153721 RepID=UPI0012DD1342|nr:hypothetical protein [Sporocytophaga myxococcoides]